MGAAIAAGSTIDEVAAKYRVSSGTARDACLVAGVAPPSRRVAIRSTGSLAILAALINTDETEASIAARMRLTRQRVNQIKQAAVAAGIAIRPRGVGAKAEAILGEVEDAD
jgi:hypothetical protein